MAKIFIFGERLLGSALGYLSIDEGSEQKIKANGTNMTTYECEIPSGRHVIRFFTNSKTQRVLSGIGNDGSFLGNLGEAMSSSQADSFEYEMTLKDGEVLVLHVVEKVTKTYIEYKVTDEAECEQLRDELYAPAASTGSSASSASGEKNKWVALLLCFFFGVIGIHKFYEGKIGMGVLYICTFGLCGIGVLVDFIRILLKPTVYTP